ncbi:hypothetical protein [Mycobacteroides abscessus]|uniref:hypothetical protein n=1 Tax=Mycobacteroides abscessus TaxID=36809 RepID=UPI00092948B1|nr:hypothetical protein [Mycobacteroides abscessus]SIE96682.1 Uncharacterised protein [Mycobacteroides abscessus subsp. abscessus]SKO98164.1 Uncharacterised protein [Mycobacteroides abscessus subsp. abscessus]
MRTQEALDPLEGGERRRPTKEAAGNVTPETQRSGSPWGTDQVMSWVSPNIKKNKKEE